MEVSLAHTSELEHFLATHSAQSLSKLTISSEAISPPNFPSFYNLLIQGGELIIDSADLLTYKRHLLFSGFCKVSISNDKIHSFKPLSTSAMDLKAAWSNALDSNTELINEADLLEDDEEYKNLAGAEDCMTRAKPCKNCTCGRASELANNTPVVSSSCGRCNLGDAFRCAGCPFRGTPAFAPGQKAPQDLDSIITETTAKVQGGKVKLEI